MNVKQHVADEGAKLGVVLHLTHQEVEMGLLPGDPMKMTERRMEEIGKRATVVGPVLEAILQDQHGYNRWGLNE